MAATVMATAMTPTQTPKITFPEKTMLRTQRIGAEHFRMSSFPNRVLVMRRLSYHLSRTAAIALLGACSLAGRAAAQTPSGGDLLRAMLKAERTASYVATEVVTQRDSPTLRTRIWRQGLKRRVEFLEPPVRRGDLLVDDGTNVWLYHNREEAAVQTRSLRRAAEAASLNNRIGNIPTHVSGPVSIAGRRAWIVETRGGKNKKRILRRHWIDTATKVRLRVDRFGPGGTVSESSALQNVQFSSIPAARFVWTPAPGTKITRTSGRLFTQLAPAKRVAQWLQYPRVVPAGYSFESAIVDNKKGEAWLRYTNGVQRFSVFQQRAGDPSTLSALAEPRRVDGGWYWQGGGSRMLGVDIPNSLADRVINSIR
jgi:outer membrane lipoprotein-sorting protein